MIDKAHWFLFLLITLELLKDGDALRNRRIKRVISAHNATATGEMLYMAQLRNKDQKASVCGATVITSLHLLSAAHCFWSFQMNNIWNDLSDYEFVVGKNSSGEDGQSYEIEEIYVPLNFNNDDTFDSDIIVARLSRRIIFDSNVAPAKLPFRKEKYNVKAMIGGWGFSRKFQIPKNLQKLEVVNVEGSVCEKTYNVHVTSRSDSMCAHKNNNIGYGLCMGDGGGGLVRYNVVFGVASAKFSQRCTCALDEYTIVWHHMEWILSVLDDKIPHDICVVKNLI